MRINDKCNWLFFFNIASSLEEKQQTFPELNRISALVPLTGNQPHPSPHFPLSPPYPLSVHQAGLSPIHAHLLPSHGRHTLPLNISWSFLPYVLIDSSPTVRGFLSSVICFTRTCSICFILWNLMHESLRKTFWGILISWSQ